MSLCGCLKSEKADQKDLGNPDETHFIFDVDSNGKTLGFSGCYDVKYGEVVRGGEGLTMMSKISVGRDAVIDPPFSCLPRKTETIKSLRECQAGVPDYIKGA